MQNKKQIYFHSRAKVSSRRRPKDTNKCDNYKLNSKKEEVLPETTPLPMLLPFLSHLHYIIHIEFA